MCHRIDDEACASIGSFAYSPTCMYGHGVSIHCSSRAVCPPIRCGRQSPAGHISIVAWGSPAVCGFPLNFYEGKPALPIKSDSSASCTVWPIVHSTAPNRDARHNLVGDERSAGADFMGKARGNPRLFEGSPHVDAGCPAHCARHPAGIPSSNCAINPARQAPGAPRARTRRWSRTRRTWP